jgi:HK97 family phage prohead protease
MQHKSFAFRITEAKANDAGTEAEFDGYASVFGNKDLGGDIVQPGAFKRTLDHSQGRPFPLLADHDYTLKGRLGVAYCTEDGQGLRVKGIINLESEAGREVYSHLKQAQAHGVDLGMSFGYSIPAGGASFDREKQARLIHEVKLYEVTVTQFPMNPEAGVEDVKATTFDDAFDRYLQSSQLSTEYWAMEDARFTALDSALYDYEMGKEERLAPTRCGSSTSTY